MRTSERSSKNEKPPAIKKPPYFDALKHVTNSINSSTPGRSELGKVTRGFTCQVTTYVVGHDESRVDRGPGGLPPTQPKNG